jgi:hypothetical protein
MSLRVEVLSVRFPLWKRGMEGDFYKVTESLLIHKISPNPIVPKRGQEKEFLIKWNSMQSMSS